MGMFEKWGIADVSNLSSYPWTPPYSNGTYWGPAECSSPSPSSHLFHPRLFHFTHPYSKFRYSCDASHHCRSFGPTKGGPRSSYAQTENASPKKNHSTDAGNGYVQRQKRSAGAIDIQRFYSNSRPRIHLHFRYETIFISPKVNYPHFFCSGGFDSRIVPNRDCLGLE